ncbi:MAG: hypothetical protein IBJ03_13985 [Gemmatimonadaceae bacterium]|nr:hypothetical protein [Gemmatimonadaceae bacterium]
MPTLSLLNIIRGTMLRTRMPLPAVSLLHILAAATISMNSAAQQAVPIIAIPDPTVASQQTFGAILGLNHLPSGDVVVNDAGRRQVLKLSPTLATLAVIIDSTPGTSNSYGTRPAPLIRYLGDSSLFVDPTSASLLVIDPTGKITRAMSAPNPMDMRLIASSPAYIDHKGRLIYRGSIVPRPPSNGPSSMPPSGIPPMPLLRADFDRRTVDTLGAVKSGNGSRGSMVPGADGKMQIRRLIDPLFVVDDYAVLSDGSVAIVRGQDYRVDMLPPDGQLQQGKKLPYDWKRLTEQDKVRLRDSVLKTPPPLPTPAGGAMPMMASGGGSNSGGGSFSIGAAGGTSSSSSRITPEMLSGASSMMPTGAGVVDVIPVKEMADYLPPIRSGAARPDLEGNLWLLPNTSAQSLAGELVYDVVNRDGVLTHRVRVPKGRSVLGFGAGGIVYLMTGDRTNGFTVERSTVPSTR